MTRSQSREQAFALLFEKSFNPETDMDDIISLSLENELIEPDEFASMLAQTAWDKLFSIDDIIEKYSKNWKKHRISRVALSAMRLSICELMYIPEVPVGTSINEAVELCKKYATAEDASFVNGVLGSVVREEKLADRSGSDAPEGKQAMAVYLGIDTSNYTTSAAAFDDVSGCVFQKKMLLPVKSGERGLRQSDAVFHHTQQLWQVVSAVIDECGKPDFIGASYAPRDAEGSYMPCFTVGLNTAKCLSSALGVPLYEFSHQAGHVAAAVYSSGHIELFDREFIAFHVSGGTTEALLVRPDEEKLLNIDIIGRTLDLNAGQAVDRVGVAMGLKFPAGAELEKLALKSQKVFKPKPCVKGTDCCLSGIENKCLDMIKSGEEQCDIALYCLDSVSAALEKMTKNILGKYGNLPLVFAGGVMSNSIIRQRFTKEFGAYFAEPAFSADNAAGTAYLTYLREQKNA